jgi:ABC-type dipeptide/oligopeptide/nickel transport system permease subunit
MPVCRGGLALIQWDKVMIALVVTTIKVALGVVYRAPKGAHGGKNERILTPN